LEPSGFFGERDAKSDMKISNAMLSLGGRVALPLGYVVVGHQSLRQYLASRWGADRFSLIEKNISVVEQNKDRVVIYFRLGGSRARLYFTREGEIPSPEFMKQELALGASLLLNQYNNYPKQMEQVWPNSPYDAHRAFSGLSSIAGKKQILKSDVAPIIEFASRSIVLQESYLKKVGETIGNSWFERFVFGSYSNGAKDIDTSFIHYDFEISGIALQESPFYAMQWAPKIVERYQQRLTTTGLIYKKHALSRQQIANMVTRVRKELSQ
jgi:hypothetical protein